MIDKNNTAQKSASLKIKELSLVEEIPNDLWCELNENTQEAIKGGLGEVIAKWGNWQYSMEIGWHCQPGKVC